jgi:hypothetical protein
MKASAIHLDCGQRRLLGRAAREAGMTRRRLLEALLVVGISTSLMERMDHRQRSFVLCRLGEGGSR